MARTGKQIYGYVEPDIKDRVKRVAAKDGRSESWVINKCLELSLAEVEKEVGIQEPVQKASPKRRNAA